MLDRNDQSLLLQRSIPKDVSLIDLQDVACTFIMDLETSSEREVCLTRKRYYVQMLMFAVVLPATFIVLGMFDMSILEPVPEFGGYDREWSRTVRSVISLLLMVVAFRCAHIHLQSVSSSINSTSTATKSGHRLGQAVVIAILVLSSQSSKFFADI